ncbi:hypothetical protein Angca_005451, partial [Angiostrongylus cantonensis]
QWRRDPSVSGPYGNVGELLENMFDGEAGEKFLQATTTFCENQDHALEALRARCETDKDESLVRFLVEAGKNPLCRRLQLKDHLPVEMQRLVKYPLLLEAIAEYTDVESEEYGRLLRTVESTKRILRSVNEAKANVESVRRLEELQRRYRLVHHGPLMCRFSRDKTIKLHVVLLENILVFLTKHTKDKLQLKALEASKKTKRFPIMPLASLMVKENAHDRCALFLIFDTMDGVEIYDLVAATASEVKT